jgi:hypothetical protein
VFAILGAGVAYLLTVNPTDRRADAFGQCLWHELTGIDGPTCGGTRMAWYLLHGNFVEAARHHLIALLTVPVLLYALIAWTARSMFGITLPTYRPGWRTYTAYAVVFLVYSVVLRNLPWAPFDWFYVPYLQQ